MEQQEPNKLLVPGAIVVAGALIAVAIYAGGGGAPTDNRQPTAGEIKVAKVTSEDHILGSRNAEIIIVEYSDTECPFCKVFHNTMKEVVASYDGKVAWVYRHLPIPQLHSLAMKEAEATECVAELGGEEKFWLYLDDIFTATNSNDSLNPAELPKMAAAHGIDTAAFNECLSSGRYTEKIEESMAEAAKAGARGTPYSIIIAKNGDKATINGAEPLANVKAKIDALLK